MECSFFDIVSLASSIQKQEDLIQELEERNTKQAQTILDLQSLLAKSQSRITELEARLGLHSGNSSFPPSHDIVLPPKPVTLRKKSGRKAGGQKNVKA